MFDPKTHIYALLNLTLRDRVFFVPFWDCPYLCEFCCVDSLPGKAPGWPDGGEDVVFAMLAEMHRRYGRRVELHFYGGEPMLRAGYVEHVAQRVAATPHIKKMVLYTTLRSKSPRRVLEILGPKRLQILVNPDMVNERAAAALVEFKGVAELNSLPVHLVTGRGAVGGAGQRPDWHHTRLPVGWPGRSCFGRATGPLVNGPQRTVHFCCLPQSPIMGTFDEDATALLDHYDDALASVPKALNQACRAVKGVHPCGVCNKYSGYQSQAGPGHNSYRVSEALALA